MKLYHFSLIFVLIAGMVLSVTFVIAFGASAAAREEMYITDTLVNSGRMAADGLRSEPEVITEGMVNSIYRDYIRTLTVGLGANGYEVVMDEIGRYIPVFAVISPGGVRISCFAPGSEGNRSITDCIRVQNSYELIDILEQYVEKANLIGESYGLSYGLNIELDSLEGHGFETDGYGVISLFQNFPTRVRGRKFNRTVLIGVSLEEREA